MELQERLRTIAAKFEAFAAQMADPGIAADPDRYRQIAKAYSELERVVERYREYEKIEGEIREAQSLADDPDLRGMAREDLALLEPKRDALLAELRELLLPRDPNDEKNVILEIRAGTGGEEASLFASELYRMYSRYAERRGWTVEVLTLSSTGLGGLKEVIALISGKQVYSRLKHESGVHRVQRVPATESAGRIHTSTATVAVLPEADDVQIQINDKDLRIDTFCATGPGGQGVNTTYSAIRITHLPTGLVVQCQDERSQHKNKARAMKVLRSRMLEVEQQKQRDAIAQDRRSQVGTGERSEKIRTYNFPQNRVTDHRVNVTLHRLPDLLDGALDPLVEPILAHYQAERLKEEVGAGA
ncbi:MAG TPA: peptide chain release factor 1 [Candidatus Polarisedimenticolia bacterium]|nr:peptide chain release factor 1 [Candidatus Polarisedimenticolia bacterium]